MNFLTWFTHRKSFLFCVEIKWYRINNKRYKSCLLCGFIGLKETSSNCKGNAFVKKITYEDNWLHKLLFSKITWKRQTEWGGVVLKHSSTFQRRCTNAKLTGNLQGIQYFVRRRIFVHGNRSSWELFHALFGWQCQFHKFAAVWMKTPRKCETESRV